MTWYPSWLTEPGEHPAQSPVEYVPVGVIRPMEILIHVERIDGCNQNYVCQSLFKAEEKARELKRESGVKEVVIQHRLKKSA